ncbi:conserved hypothetical protein [Ricinus communis]|uniref:Uncharacterized protein n=1 Tax=Ricinus communis TaxID=3988 RepID=B9S4C4_RICCO|nr:conserved hypothetical protein [Ricinus communis]
MCLNAGNSFCGICEVQLQFQLLSLSTLCEVGYSAHDRFELEVRMDKGFKKHNLVEDG